MRNNRKHTSAISLPGAALNLALASRHELIRLHYQINSIYHSSEQKLSTESNATVGSFSAMKMNH
jgi:hypothetical protein